MPMQINCWASSWLKARRTRKPYPIYRKPMSLDTNERYTRLFLARLVYIPQQKCASHQTNKARTAMYTSQLIMNQKSLRQHNRHPETARIVARNLRRVRLRRRVRAPRPRPAPVRDRGRGRPPRPEGVVARLRLGRARSRHPHAGELPRCRNPERPHLVASPLRSRGLGPRAPFVLLGRRIGGEGHFDGVGLRRPLPRGGLVLDGDMPAARSTSAPAPGSAWSARPDSTTRDRARAWAPAEAEPAPRRRSTRAAPRRPAGAVPASAAPRSRLRFFMCSGTSADPTPGRASRAR